MQEVWRCEVDHVSNYKSSSPKNIRYGKLQGLSKREEMTIISIIENTIERTGEIENICGREHSFNSIPAEQPVKTLSDIYQAASILREAWKIGSAAITNVINLLESNGVITAEIDALDPFISQHAILDDTIPVMFPQITIPIIARTLAVLIPRRNQNRAPLPRRRSQS